MAEHHLARQAERQAKLAYFVLEQFAQRLQQLQVQAVRQSAHVVVRLDRDCLLGLRARGLDDVRVYGALREPLCILDGLRLFLEDIDKQLANDLALLLRIRDALERLEHVRARIDVDDLHLQVLPEGVHHLPRFVVPQQAVVDEDAGELLADGLVDQRGGDR